MFKDSHNPRWWILYSLLILLMAFFFLGEKASLTAAAHRIFEIIMVMLLFGVVWLWLIANEGSIAFEDQQKYRRLMNILPADQSAHKEAMVISASQQSLDGDRGWTIWKAISAWTFVVFAAIAHFFHRLIA